MCSCTPGIKTPFCGRGDCKWPPQALIGPGTPPVSQGFDLGSLAEDKSVSMMVLSAEDVALWVSQFARYERLRAAAEVVLAESSASSPPSLGALGQLSTTLVKIGTAPHTHSAAGECRITELRLQCEDLTRALVDANTVILRREAELADAQKNCNREKIIAERDEVTLAICEGEYRRWRDIRNYSPKMHSVGADEVLYVIRRLIDSLKIAYAIEPDNKPLTVAQADKFE